MDSGLNFDVLFSSLITRLLLTLHVVVLHLVTLLVPSAVLLLSLTFLHSPGVLV